MVAPSIAINRWDLGITIEEFDLVANQGGYIGPSVLRPMVVRDQSGNIPRVKDNQLSTLTGTARAPGGAYKRDDFEFDGLGYTCSEFGHEVALDDATLAIYASVVDAEGIATRRNTHKILSDYEIACAAALYNTAVWQGAALTTALGTPWSTHATSTPIDDIQAAKEKGIAKGIEFNALVCNRRQLWHLLQSAQLLARMSELVNKSNITVRSALLELLDVDMIKVAGGLKNTANQGQATAAYSRIWSNDYAQVCRIAVTDDPTENCIGRTVLWTGDGAGAAGTEQALAVVTEEYREEGVRGSVIRSRNWRGLKILRAECGHLLSNVAAS